MKWWAMLLLCLLMGAMAQAAEQAATDPYRVEGSIVTYGRYEQDADESNGTEPIEWIVLEYDGTNNRALLLSRYGLDCRAYHGSSRYPTWEKSDIRAWLNGSFIRAAFTEREASRILETSVHTEGNVLWTAHCQSNGWYYDEVSGGEDCLDKLFLLSLEEAMQYAGHAAIEDFRSEGMALMQAAATEYAARNGAYQSDEHMPDGEGCCWWWLRSSGNGVNYASGVYDSGCVYCSFAVDFPLAVRPAFWLRLCE